MNKEEWVTKQLRRRLYIDCRQDYVKYDQLLIPNDFTLHHRSMCELCMRGMKECCVVCKEGWLCELCMRGMKECCVACKEGWLCELCMRGMKECCVVCKEGWLCEWSRLAAL